MTQTSRYPQAAQLFALDTARHQMTVLHDDGLYRHITFRAPDTNLYWFDLVTWPGCLTFNGDMGTYTFARVSDMINFFKGPGDINPGYWGEKVQGNGDSRDKGVTAWSAKRFRERVTEAFNESGRHHEHAAALWAAIESEVLEHEEDEREAMQAATSFEFMDPGERNKTLFTFFDAWEWGATCQDFKHAFLYACFAVQHGVNRYLASRIESADPDAVAVNVSRVRPPVPPRHTQRNAVVQRPSARQLATLQPREEFL